MPRAYLLLLTMDFGIFLGFFYALEIALFFAAGKLLGSLLILLRMLKGCTFQWQEFFAMYYYLLICPLISGFYLIKGNFKEKTFIFFK